MLLKTIQWNIGGGKIRKEDSDSESEESYNIDGVEYINNLISKYSPDIITLVETHASENEIQAEHIAKNLKYKYWVNDVYDKSHIEAGKGLGQAIISRFPISSHNFAFFFNPKFEIIRPNGEKWISHDKGLTTCDIDIDGKSLTAMTLHLIPFRKFGVSLDDPRVEQSRISIAKMIETDKDHVLLQGDFNVDDQSLNGFLPEVISKTEEVLLAEPTTPKGRKYDHVVYKGIKHIKSEVIESLTDHYLVYSEFEF